MPKIIIANWKMHPRDVADALALAKATDSKELVITPPFTFLSSVAGVLKKSSLGAQNLSWEDEGAFTGEVSGSQLVALGVRYVIIGHSERRRYLGETDEMVAKKVVAALRNGLVPILCIGETNEERRRGEGKAVLKRQLFTALEHVGATSAEIILTYEPVWAISTEPDAEADTPLNALEMIGYMGEEFGSTGTKLKPQFIYGGSVNSANAELFLKHADIQGALVGGASLKPAEIKKIVEIAKIYE